LEVDARSDLFSLGVVLYELIAGCQPFTGPTSSDVLAALLLAEPLPLARFVPQIPAELQSIVHRLLAKERAKRYQSAAELHDDLERLRAELTLQAQLQRKADAGGATMLELSLGQTAREAAPRAQADQSTRAAAASVAALAVLPLRILGGTPAGVDAAEYLGLGLADALITRLSKLRELQVRPTSAILRFNTPDCDVVAAGRQLNVDAVLEGSLRQAQDRLRVTVQLVSVADQRTLWAAQFDERFTDIFAVEDLIAASVTTGLKLRLTGEEQQLLTKHHTENLEAYELYLQGIYQFNKYTSETFAAAVTCFNQATAKDPQYALAWAMLCMCYTMIHMNAPGPPSPEIAQLAKAAARQALALDDALADAHAAQAFAKLLCDWDQPGALAAARHAVGLSPHTAVPKLALGWALAAQGQLAEAAAVMREAQQADPFSPMTRVALANVYLYSRLYEEAIAVYNQVLELSPSFRQATLGSVQADILRGHYVEALARLNDVTDLPANPLQQLLQRFLQACVSGVPGTAPTMAEVQELIGRGDQRAQRLAAFCALIGDKESAFELLERAYEERDPWLIFLGVAPQWDGLRADARFASLLRRVGCAT
jgi:TolB-like protein/Tfp pilus assembly protein PilF